MKTFRQAINTPVEYPVDTAFTDNGAVTLRSSTNPLVDLFFLAGSSRGKDLTNQFSAAFNHNPNLTSSLMLWARDVRGGAGERQLFRDYLNWLYVYHPDMAKIVIESGKIQEVGRWDDYLVFAFGDLMHDAFTQIAYGLSNKETVGLVSKWMPRQGPVASRLANFFGLSARNWRKTLVLSTNVVEQQMCAKKWDDIIYDHVPSVAAARYQKSFTRHSPTRYAEYRASLEKNDGSAKINASAVYPYDILKSAAFGDQTVAMAQWESLPDYLGSNGGILPIIDVSWSMTAAVPGTKLSMMDVAISIGMYIALKQQGDFNRVIMNFSSQSEIVHIKSRSLRQIYTEVAGMNWEMSTDLNQAYHNLLQFGKDNNIADSDMPKTILIISDMEFNACGHLTNMESIRKMYAQSGYTLPNIIFWCINGRPKNVPVRHDMKGVAMVSGFSPAIMKTVLSCEEVTPEHTMMKTISNPRYSLA